MRRFNQRMKYGLELMIDRPIPGHFYWTIARSEAGKPTEVVAHAHGPLPTETAATTQGLAALRALQADIGDVPVVHVPADPAWNVVTQPGVLS